MKKCDCEQNEYDYHEEECAKVQEMLATKNLLFFPCDGEIEAGGVYIDPLNLKKIWVLCDRYFFPVKPGCRRW